jgi:hypothetical protein
MVQLVLTVTPRRIAAFFIDGVGDRPHEPVLLTAREAKLGGR